jgi:hypothetical protein
VQGRVTLLTHKKKQMTGEKPTAAEAAAATTKLGRRNDD